MKPDHPASTTDHIRRHAMGDRPRYMPSETYLVLVDDGRCLINLLVFLSSDLKRSDCLDHRPGPRLPEVGADGKAEYLVVESLRNWEAARS